MAEYQGDYQLTVVSNPPLEEPIIEYTDAAKFKLAAQDLLLLNPGTSLHARSYRAPIGVDSPTDNGGRYEHMEAYESVCREIAQSLNGVRTELKNMWEATLEPMTELRELLGSGMSMFRFRGYNPDSIENGNRTEEDPVYTWINTVDSELTVDDAQEQSQEWVDANADLLKEWWQKVFAVVGKQLNTVGIAPAGGTMFRPMAMARLDYKQGRNVDEIPYYAPKTIETE